MTAPGVPRPNRFVGQPIRRTEDARLLTGQGTFIADFHLPDMLHAAILRSPVAHARVMALDTRAARAVPGVRAVLTAADLGEIPCIPMRMARAAGCENFLQPVIAADRVRYAGEPLAIVLATTRAIAEDALERIEPTFDPLPVIASMDASQQEETLLFPARGTNRSAGYHVGAGDVAAAFDAAAYTRLERFSVQRHTAVPMETRGLVAAWDASRGHMQVWGAAKVAFLNRRVLAGMLGVAETAVDLIELDVGGGFGVRGEFYPEDFLIPFAARCAGRPVRWIEGRGEHLLATNHARDLDCTLEIACAADGTILGLRGLLRSDMGAYVRTNGIVSVGRAAQFLPGPYRIPNIAIEVRALLTNKTPVGSYRGPGRFEANFFRERLLDMAASDLGIDPASFRRKNLIRRSEMPYAAGKLVPWEGPAVFDSGDYPAVFERCLSTLGWTEKQSLQGRTIDGRRRGIGLACHVESGGGGSREHAKLAIGEDGTVAVHTGSSATGQGIATSFAQIAADALSLPLDRVRVRQGSTTLLSDGVGSFHGRSLVMGGSAIINAAAALLTQVRLAAASRYGCEPDAVVIDGEVVLAAGVSSTFVDYAGVAADGVFASEGLTYSYGTHAAHVAVDVETGCVTVLDYVAVDDAGRVVNPLIVQGQKHGAIVQGIGGTLMEHLVYDTEGQLLTGSLADYGLPRAGDVPSLNVTVLELCAAAGNPLGAKGAGEDAIGPVAAAICNAVAAALVDLGVQPRDLPLTPLRVWASLQGLAKEPCSENDSGPSRAIPQHHENPDAYCNTNLP
jgi:carbon-monoxide dehydrogenase large subunit